MKQVDSTRHTVTDEETQMKMCPTGFSSVVEMWDIPCDYGVKKKKEKRKKTGPK